MVTMTVMAGGDRLWHFYVSFGLQGFVASHQLSTATCALSLCLLFVPELAVGPFSFPCNNRLSEENGAITVGPEGETRWAHGRLFTSEKDDILEGMNNKGYNEGAHLFTSEKEY